MGHAQPTPVFVSASIPAAHPAVDSAPSPAVVASPVKGAAVSSSPSSQREEPYISADGASTTDEGEGSSPEGDITCLGGAWHHTQCCIEPHGLAKAKEPGLDHPASASDSDVAGVSCKQSPLLCADAQENEPV